MSNLNSENQMLNGRCLNNLVNFGDSNYQPLAEVLASLEGLVPPEPIADPNAKPEPTSGSKAAGSAFFLFGQKDLLLLDDVACYWPDGNVMESFANVGVLPGVMKAAFLKNRNSTFSVPLMCSLFNAVQLCERHSISIPKEASVYFVLPSMALECNILEYIFKHGFCDPRQGGTPSLTAFSTLDPEFARFLNKYDNSTDYFKTLTNTLIYYPKDTDGLEIFHYPSELEFSAHAGVGSINSRNHFNQVSHSRPAGTHYLDDMLKQLKNHSWLDRMLKFLTGLKDPAVLCDIASQYNKVAVIKFPDHNENLANMRRAAALYFTDDSLVLSLDEDLGKECTFQGVYVSHSAIQNGVQISGQNTAQNNTRELKFSPMGVYYE